MESRPCRCNQSPPAEPKEVGLLGIAGDAILAVVAGRESLSVPYRFLKGSPSDRCGGVKPWSHVGALRLET